MSPVACSYSGRNRRNALRFGKLVHPEAVGHQGFRVCGTEIWSGKLSSLLNSAKSGIPIRIFEVRQDPERCSIRTRFLRNYIGGRVSWALSEADKTIPVRFRASRKALPYFLPVSISKAPPHPRGRGHRPAGVLVQPTFLLWSAEAYPMYALMKIHRFLYRSRPAESATRYQGGNVRFRTWIAYCSIRCFLKSFPVS